MSTDIYYWIYNTDRAQVGLPMLTATGTELQLEKKKTGILCFLKRAFLRFNHLHLCYSAILWMNIYFQLLYFFSPFLPFSFCTAFSEIDTCLFPFHKKNDGQNICQKSLSKSSVAAKDSRQIMWLNAWLLSMMATV